MTLREVFGVGVEPKELTVLHVCMRTLVIFFSALIMVRIADRRFLGRKSGFDVLVGFILASTLSRAINGSAELLPTIAVGFFTVFLHRLLAKTAFHSDTFSNLIKGEPRPLIENGKMNRHNMSCNDVTEGDLMESVRLQGNLDDLKKVRNAHLERSGEISVIHDQ